MKSKLILKITLALAIVAVTITIDGKHKFSTLAQQPPSLPQVEDSNTSSKELIDEVWGIIDRNYIDSTFNGQDWEAVRLEYLNRNYESPEEVYQATQEMLQLLGDPFTRFMNPEEFRQAQLQSSEEFVGVGLKLIQDKKTQKLIVTSPVEVTPAYQAGILPGDVLIQIDGENVQGLFKYEVYSRLRGSVEGEIVILGVRRGQQELEFEVPTTKLKSTAVHYRRQDTTSSAISIGYIRLSTFSENSADKMREAIIELEKQNVSGYILDLRSNPGGLLLSSIKIARMWLEQGDISFAVDRRGELDRQQANNSALTDKPLVILVNEGTVSGAEILASALQENQRAVLVGTRTGGYNSIQSVRRVGDASVLAVTIAKWYTPNGKDIDQSGLTPDVVVDIPSEQYRRLIQGRTIGTPLDPQYSQAVGQLLQLMEKNSSQS